MLDIETRNCFAWAIAAEIPQWKWRERSER